MMGDKPPVQEPSEEDKTFEVLRVFEGTINAEPVDTPWYASLIMERTGPERDNIDHWVVHLTLGYNTTHMPMRVFRTLQEIIAKQKV